MPTLRQHRALATLFGIPVDGFGVFATLLVSTAAGALTFFLVTFLSIVGIMIYDYGFGHHLTLAASYKCVALPAGILVLIASLLYLGGLWLRRKLRGNLI